MHENEIGTLIVDRAMHLHQDLGPGLLETVYEVTLAAKLGRRGLSAFDFAQDLSVADSAARYIAARPTAHGVCLLRSRHTPYAVADLRWARERLPGPPPQTCKKFPRRLTRGGGRG